MSEYDTRSLDVHARAHAHTHSLILALCHIHVFKNILFQAQRQTVTVHREEIPEVSHLGSAQEVMVGFPQELLSAKY